MGKEKTSTNSILTQGLKLSTLQALGEHVFERIKVAKQNKSVNKVGANSYGEILKELSAENGKKWRAGFASVYARTVIKTTVRTHIVQPINEHAEHHFPQSKFLQAGFKATMLSAADTLLLNPAEYRKTQRMTGANTIPVNFHSLHCGADAFAARQLSYWLFCLGTNETAKVLFGPRLSWQERMLSSTASSIFASGATMVLDGIKTHIQSVNPPYHSLYEGLKHVVRSAQKEGMRTAYRQYAPGFLPRVGVNIVTNFCNTYWIDYLEERRKAPHSPSTSPRGF